MAGEHQHHEHGTVAPQAGHEQHTCPACGSPVETLVRRRKSLGIFVPEWVPGPCHNPECPKYEHPEGLSLP
ncbi:hypothetical protein MTF65_12195 [Streptomyces sp. APSN-46.1]|uniref:hypothetical protein n=1 Tax=Streptomyces sp. APSN-46.1 TaxID=2929049 RepID=UPI001FB35BDC|nr:hypothetical protein [Streptomyces sp. APSN-46.1]MCJ1678093.1 hypothetical protein [Streptomyces sp. APSN-46.1]